MKSDHWLALGRRVSRVGLNDLLIEVSEFLDNYVDVVDGPGGEDGPDVRPNKAMSLKQRVDELLMP